MQPKKKKITESSEKKTEFKKGKLFHKLTAASHPYIIISEAKSTPSTSSSQTMNRKLQSNDSLTELTP